MIDQEEYDDLIQAVNDKYRCKEDLHRKLKHEDVSGDIMIFILNIGICVTPSQTYHLALPLAVALWGEEGNVVV